LAKPGLDGHDVGVKLIGRALMDAGVEVDYIGLRQSTENIVAALEAKAYDVMGLSILSGAHLSLCRRLQRAMADAKLERPTWVVGGVIPDRDHQALHELGVDAIFPTRTPFEDVVRYVQERVER
jgi:methylmalonyl-CoA mutase C-terminal domain/subunit